MPLLPPKRPEILDRLLRSYWADPLFFALLTAISAQATYRVFEIPFTLQTLVVYSAGLWIGAKKGSLSQLIYLLAGMLLPVFAAGGIGLQYLYDQPSGGFLAAFPLVAWTIGAINKRHRSWLRAWLAVQAGSLVLFAIGLTRLYYYAGDWTVLQVLEAGWFGYLPVDQLKILLASSIYVSFPRIRKNFEISSAEKVDTI